MRDYLDEARRYYCNIVGKYGGQVQAVLQKAAKLEIAMLCPLHGFVWRQQLGDYPGQVPGLEQLYGRRSRAF